MSNFTSSEMKEKSSESRKKKKELFVIILIFSIIISTVLFYTYIKYSPITDSEIPIITIKTTDDIKTDKYTDCTFELKAKEVDDNIEPINSKIKIRGSFNAKMPKKGYRLELSEPKSLLSMREDDDWQLFAMFMDITKVRIKLSMDLWRSLLATDEEAILPQSRYVFLYLNGKFQGLYLLAEKNDRKLFNLDDAQNNLNSSLIFQAGTRKTDFKDYRYQDWDQDWPNEYEGIYIMNDIMLNLIDFIVSSPDEIFFNSTLGIYSKFDKINLIDFLLFNFFILHKDFWANNYYLVRNTYPNKFFLIPWDFDQSMGEFLTRKYDPEENPESEIYSRNFLYYRLMQNKEFMSAAKERWFILRDTIWTEESIINMVEDLYNEIREILEIDADLWYPKLYGSLWNNQKIDEYINYLFNWIPERLIFCDNYFNKY